MQTQELQTKLQALNWTANGLGQRIQNARKNQAQYEAEAERLMSMAQRTTLSANESDDINAIISLSNHYMNQAEAYRRQARKLQPEIDEMISELRKCRTDYQNFMTECQKNLVDLKHSADILLGVSANKYGGSKLKEALNVTKQRLLENQSLAEGCQQAINWIDQICGPEGEVQKVIRLK